MLSKQYRLQSSSDIKNVLANGKSTRSGFLFLKFFPNKLAVSRFAFSVGISYSKSAVKRNALKRKLRKVMESKLDQTEKGYDCFFFTRKDNQNQNDKLIESHVTNCLLASQLLKNK